MKYIAIIPARYASTRFPGKPLELLAGKPIIQHVYERVRPLVDDAIVATDDARIQACVQAFGGQVIMTGTHHRSGTDRCWEAYTRYQQAADVVINVQGDEPFVSEAQITQLKACFDQPMTQIATLVKAFSPDTPYQVLSNPNTPKVVLGDDQRALYFSRSVIPYLRGVDTALWAAQHTYYKHIGLYAFTTASLQAVTQLPPASLEVAESLEQLRWLQHGLHIAVAITQDESIGIDTPEDLKRAQELLNSSKN